MPVNDNDWIRQYVHLHLLPGSKLQLTVTNSSCKNNKLQPAVT